MKKGFLRLLYVVLMLVLLEQIAYADVAPPIVGNSVIAISLGAVVVLGFLVAIVVFISAVVIRVIKKRQTPTDDA